MVVALALTSALAFGTGDFLGGLAARRVASATVVLWSYVLSGVLLVVASIVVSGTFAARDVVIGSAAGLLGAVGIALLYRALAIGQMSAVAPVTAIFAAAVPVLAGVLRGERPGPAVAVGMVAGAVAVVLVSAEGGGTLRPADRRAAGIAVAAGVLFGLFFVALAETDDGSGLWPLVGARWASVAAIGLLVAAGRWRAVLPKGSTAALVAGAGTFDGAGNVLYLLAIREGLLSVTSVLSSLYPVATVALAWFVLRERFSGLQRAGLLLAVPAAVLMAR